MMNKVTVVLADDHVLLRSGLKLLLESRPNIHVIGEVSDGEEAIRIVEDLKPDIIILDIAMPNIDGIGCIKEIKNRGLKTKIIVLTMYDDENYIKEVICAGAVAYVQKGSVDTELFLAIEEVKKGNMYLSSKDSKALLNMLINMPQPKPDGHDPYIILSPREREVLRLIVRGYSLKEIAGKLFLSVKTVDTYKTRIMEKLDFTRKSDLIEYAIKYGLLTETTS